MRISRANNNAMKYACRNFHYSKVLPAINFGYNVFNDKDEWCGCIIFGYGANKALGKEFRLYQGEVFELTRVALNGKQEQTSKALSMCIKQFHKDYNMCKLIVSYADVNHNHLGIIYQATNWIYVGLCNVGMKSGFIINGKIVHNRQVSTILMKYKFECSRLEQLKKIYGEDVFYQENHGKQKYLYCFDKRLKKEIEKQRKPYPKSDENWVKIDRNKFKKNGTQNT